jgi:hypothetical protein
LRSGYNVRITLGNGKIMTHNSQYKANPLYQIKSIYKTKQGFEIC